MDKLNGLLAVNKPTGIVSHDVVEYMRNVLLHFKTARPWLSNGVCDTAALSVAEHLIPLDSQLKKGKKQKQFRKWPVEAKVGHGGTLDPLASGVLVLGIGSATKSLQHYLSKTRKVYVASGILGSSTDTYDSTGVVIKSSSHDHISQENVERALETHFTGEISQLPPLYSALKVNGERMCDIMRKNEKKNKDPSCTDAGSTTQQAAMTKARQSRKVTIYSSELLEWNGSDKEFKIRISCSSGTYIRSIIHDLGELLGSCAHMTQLVREAQGPFSLTSESEDSIPVLEVQQLQDYNALCAHLQNEKYKTLSRPPQLDEPDDDNNNNKRRKIDHGN